MPSISQLPSNNTPPQQSLFPYWNPVTDTTEQTTLSGLITTNARVVLADAATLTLNGATGNVFDITLTLNTVLLISGWVDGETYSVILQQSGGFGVIWPPGTKWAGGVLPTLSTGSGAIDMATFVNRGGVLLGQFAKSFA